MHKISYLDHNWLALKLNNLALQENLGLLRGVVYDLGCGTRPYEKDILSAGCTYVGIDWANTQHGSHADVVADLNGPLPIENEVADSLVSFQVLEHLCEPQVMLSEAFRILRPGGSMLITVPFQWWIHEAPYDYYRYTRHGLEHLLLKAGFKDPQIKETGGFWATWFLKLNYQSTRLIRGPKMMRGLVRAVLTPVWLLDQLLARFLDKHWRAPQEALGYVVMAVKP